MLLDAKLELSAELDKGELDSAAELSACDDTLIAELDDKAPLDETVPLDEVLAEVTALETPALLRLGLLSPLPPPQATNALQATAPSSGVVTR